MKFAPGEEKVEFVVLHYSAHEIGGGVWGYDASNLTTRMQKNLRINKSGALGAVETGSTVQTSQEVSAD